MAEIDIRSRGGRINHVFHPENGMCGATSDVRFGSKADMCRAKRHVRFTPNSGMFSANTDVG